MAWIPNPEEKKYLELIMSMTIDTLAGRGVDTPETYRNNLLVMIKGFLPVAEAEDQDPPTEGG